MLENTVIDREKAINLMLKLKLLEPGEADALKGKKLLPDSAKPLLICKGRGAYATAHLLKDGVLEVQPGSTATRDAAPRYFETSGKTWQKNRDLLVVQGKAKLRSDGTLEYLLPVHYLKPSTASAAVLGRSSDGWVEWKTTDGKSYADLVNP